jgi:hypothetical protein
MYGISITGIFLHIVFRIFSIRVIDSWNKIAAKVKSVKKYETFRQTYKQLRTNQLCRA